MKIIDIGIFDEPTSGWELDMDKFARLYPDLYKDNLAKFNSKNTEDYEYYDFIVELLDDEDKVWEVSKETPLASIFTDDGRILRLTNHELREAYFEDFNFFWDERFIMICVEKSPGQEGSLAIWDMSTLDWCFRNTDQGFCVKKIEYDKETDTFKGTCYRETQVLDAATATRSEESSFVINSKRKLEW